MTQSFFWRGLGLCVGLISIVHSLPALACECTNTNTAPVEVESETSSESAADTPAEASTPIDYATLEISELYPDPAESEEEFIEIYNAGDVVLDLSQLVLRDAAGHTYTPGESATIEAGEYLALSLATTGISLNNAGDTIELVDALGTVVCTVTYESSEEGLSWSSISGEWSWSTPSPNAVNMVLISEETTTEGTDTGAESEASTSTGYVADAEEATTQNDNATATTEAPTPTTSADVILSELLPNPETSDTTDEWIEIQNVGTQAVTLVGWQLTDTVTTFSIPETTLAPEEYAVFGIEDTHIALNNTGDTVYLIDGFGTILQGTTFDTATAGESWSFLSGTWSWSTPTPNADNVVVAIEEDTEAQEAPEAEEAAATSTQESTQLLSIADLRSQDVGASGSVEGVVTVEPGIFGDQYFYIQDDTAGIQVYSYDKQFPELSVGDRIQVEGTLSSTRNEARIKISSAQGITILSHDQAPQAIDSGELNEPLEGMLVSVEGVIASSTSTHIILDSGMDVTIKSGTDIDGNTFEDGSDITVIGIVSQYDDAYRILPRATEDISIAEAAESASSIIPTAQAATPKTYTLGSTVSASSGTAEFPWSIFLLGGSVVVCVGLGWKHVLNFAKRFTSTHARSQQIQSPLQPVQHLSWAEAQDMVAPQEHHADYSKESKLF